MNALTPAVPPTPHRPRRGGRLAGVLLVGALLLGLLPGVASAAPAATGTTPHVLGFSSDAEAAAVARQLGGTHLPGLAAVRVDGAPTAAWAVRAARYVEADAPRRLVAVPDDPGYPHQEGLRTAQFDLTWPVLERGGEGILVAVVDSGYTPHPDLAGRVRTPISVTGGPTTDSADHGTPIAGVIAANAGNGQGIAGACPRCEVLPIRVTRADGSLWASDTAAAIRAAADAGADVINLSFGSEQAAQVERDAVAHALSRGAVVVAAAGNEGSSAPFYPASLEGVVGVAGTEADGRLAAQSNRGPHVDLSAAWCTPSLSSAGDLAIFCGTSLAAPLVSAAVAVLLGEGVEDPVGGLVADAAPLPQIGGGDLRLLDALLRVRPDLRPTAPLPDVPDVEPAPTAPPTPGPGAGSGAGSAASAVDVVLGTHRDVTLVAFDLSRPAADEDAVRVRVAGRDVGTTVAQARTTAERFDVDRDLAVAVPATPGDAPEVVRISVAGTTTTATVAPDDVAAAPQHVTGLAIDVARASVADGMADAVLIASDATFADSLAASPLAAEGPVLYTAAGADAPADPAVLAEVARLLPATGACEDRRVYLLGGVNAVGSATEAAVAAAGHCPIRVAGPSRIETAIAAADLTAAAHGSDVVLLARADEWADAAAAGAFAAARRVPVLLTASDSLHPATEAWLTAHRPSTVVLLGGVYALSAEVEAAVAAHGTVQRVAGDDRGQTSMAIAAELWEAPRPAGVVLVDGWAADGWTATLAASHPAAVAGAPVVYEPTGRSIDAVDALVEAADWYWRLTNPSADAG